MSPPPSSPPPAPPPPLIPPLAPPLPPMSPNVEALFLIDAWHLMQHCALWLAMHLWSSVTWLLAQLWLLANHHLLFAAVFCFAYAASVSSSAGRVGCKKLCSRISGPVAKERAWHRMKEEQQESGIELQEQDEHEVFRKLRQMTRSIAKGRARLRELREQASQSQGSIRRQTREKLLKQSSEITKLETERKRLESKVDAADAPHQDEKAAQCPTVPPLPTIPKQVARDEPAQRSVPSLQHGQQAGDSQHMPRQLSPTSQKLPQPQKLPPPQKLLQPQKPPQPQKPSMPIKQQQQHTEEQRIEQKPKVSIRVPPPPQRIPPSAKVSARRSLSARAVPGPASSCERRERSPLSARAMPGPTSSCARREKSPLSARTMAGPSLSCERREGSGCYGLPGTTFRVTSALLESAPDAHAPTSPGCDQPTETATGIEPVSQDVSRSRPVPSLGIGGDSLDTACRSGNSSGGVYPRTDSARRERYRLAGIFSISDMEHRRAELDSHLHSARESGATPRKLSRIQMLIEQQSRACTTRR